MAGSDQLKSAWNTSIITAANTSAPPMRWVSTASMRSVQLPRVGRGALAHLGHQAIDELVARADDLEVEVAAGVGGALMDAADGGADRGRNPAELVGAVVVQRQQQPLRPRPRIERPLHEALGKDQPLELRHVDQQRR